MTRKRKLFNAVCKSHKLYYLKIEYVSLANLIVRLKEEISNMKIAKVKKTDRPQSITMIPQYGKVPAFPAQS